MYRGIWQRWLEEENGRSQRVEERCLLRCKRFGLEESPSCGDVPVSLGCCLGCLSHPHLQVL